MEEARPALEAVSAAVMARLHEMADVSASILLLLAWTARLHATALVMATASVTDPLADRLLEMADCKGAEEMALAITLRAAAMLTTRGRSVESVATTASEHATDPLRRVASEFDAARTRVAATVAVKLLVRVSRPVRVRLGVMVAVRAFDSMTAAATVRLAATADEMAADAWTAVDTARKAATEAESETAGDAVAEASREAVTALESETDSAF